MYLAILLISILYLYTIRHSGKDLLEYGIVSAGLVFFPVTSMALVALFQNFYGKNEIMWLLPMFIIPPYAVAELKEVIPDDGKKKYLIPMVCIIVFLCGWMSFDKAAELYFCQIDDAASYDEEYKEVYDLVLKNAGSGQIVMAAPRELMEHARMYDGRIGLAYGRDIWEVNLDYAFYEANIEEAYDLSKKLSEPMPSYTTSFVKDLVALGTTYVVINKDNLSYGEDMQYPKSFVSGRDRYVRMDETRHYVIYSFSNK